jgi:hypothetical protein
MMVEPAALFPVVPTAMQSSGAEHETPSRSTALAGGDWSDQVDQLSEVETANGVESKFVPTDTQSLVDEHEIELSCLPLGKVVGGDHGVLPPSSVLSVVAPPEIAMPTALQLKPVSHETAASEVTAG